MTREQKTFTFQVKSSDDAQGILTGYLSVFNNVDQGNDRVVKGAFKRTIANSKKKAKDSNNPYIIPMLWQHDPSQPIGGVTEANEDDYGLLTTAQFDLDTQKGKEAYSGYKKGYLNQLSIGYDVIKKTYDEKGVRNLEELRLWEQSTVTFAMNESALATGVKAASGASRQSQKDYNDNYRQERIRTWRYYAFQDLVDALQDSILDIFKIGDSPSSDLVSTILDNGNGKGFISDLKQYVQDGINLDISNYFQALQEQSSSYYSGYMSSSGPDAQKAGGMSQSKKDTIQTHIDDLHSAADDHLATAKKHSKALHSAADDLATVLQGSESAYTDDHGTPEKSGPSSHGHPEQKDQHSSSVDTAGISSAWEQLAALRALNKLNELKRK